MNNNQQQFSSVEERDNDMKYDSGYTWSEWFDIEDTTESADERRANIEDAEDEEADANEGCLTAKTIKKDVSYVEDSWPTDEEWRADLEAEAQTFCHSCGARTESGCFCFQKTEADTIRVPA